MHVQLVHLQLRRVLAEERASRALPPVVHLQHVRRQAFRACSLVLAQGAGERLEMGVEVPFQAPVVHTAPGTVAASVPESVQPAHRLYIFPLSLNYLNIVSPHIAPHLFSD